MHLLLLKLSLTPLFISAATLIGRRWGPVIGGWFTGLPLTSGPISLFLALEQGRDFAADAARSSLLGLVPLAAFCTGYSLGAKGKNPLRATLIALAAYFTALGCLSPANLSLLPAMIAGLLALWIALKLIGSPRPDPVNRAPERRDLPLRVGTSLALVLGITGLASLLGPKWSGMLALFPAFTWLLALFAQTYAGSTAARQLMHGVVASSFGSIVFFSLIAFAVRSEISLTALYLCALGLTLVVNGLVLTALVHEQRRR